MSKTLHVSKTLKYSCMECKFKCNEKSELNLHLWKDHNICLFVEKCGSDNEEDTEQNKNYIYYDPNYNTIKMYKLNIEKNMLGG